MKLNHQTQEFDSQGIDNKSQFKIKANAKAFHILSSSIYQDKIGSIIRELSTNAFDAQVEAGNGDKQFEVHLPTRFDPQFSIRDYGTGLSHADVMKIYTTYFESTKTNSDDVEGCLGLGSKSPFAYTDSFNVISFYNGTKSIYTAYKDESNSPCISRVHSESTDEANGMKIEFSCKDGDIYEFESKAAKIYKWFDIHPKLARPEIINPWDEDYEPYLVDGVYKFCANTYKPRNGMILLVGNIAYNVDREFLSTEEPKYSEILRRMIQSIVIRLPIGSVDFTVSREELEQTNRNKDLIKQYIDRLQVQASKDLKEKIKHLKTKVDVLKFVKGEINEYLWSHAFKESSIDFRKVIENFPGAKKFAECYKSGRGTIVIPTRLFSKFNCKHFDGATQRTGSTKQAIPFMDKPLMVFVVNETRFSRIKFNHLLDKLDKSYVTVVIQTNSKKRAAWFKEVYFDNAKVVFQDKLPKPPKQKHVYVRSDNPSIAIPLSKINQFGISSNFVPIEEFDKPFIIASYTSSHSWGKREPMAFVYGHRDLGQAIAKKKDQFDHPVYFVNKSRYESILNGPQSKKFPHAIDLKEYMQKNVFKEKVIKKLARTRMIQELDDMELALCKELAKCDSAFQNLINQTQQKIDYNDKFNKHDEVLINFLYPDHRINIDAVNLSARMETLIEDHFPCLWAMYNCTEIHKLQSLAKRFPQIIS